jgi:alpha-L-rhamnosidase
MWGVDGQVSAWSVLSPVEAGLLSASDWAAQFVTPDWDEDTTRPGPLLRREFDVQQGMVKARLYVTALGIYEEVPANMCQEGGNTDGRV